jgi:hypothetical protein
MEIVESNSDGMRTNTRDEMTNDEYQVIVSPIYGSTRIIAHTNVEEYARMVYQRCVDGFYSDVPKQSTFYLVKVVEVTYNDGREK